MLMETSSEMTHSLLPLFLATSLGASALMIGLIYGLAEATTLITKVFAGALSDWFGRRKGLALLGYRLWAAMKPLFAMAPGVGIVMTARMLDRVGKAIRGALRDALVADVTPPELRGAASGLRQSLDTIGAFTGPLLAVYLMFVWARDFQSVSQVAVVPAVLAVIQLFVGIRAPARAPESNPQNPISRANLARLSPAYRRVVAIGAVFALSALARRFLSCVPQRGLPIWHLCRWPLSR